MKKKLISQNTKFLFKRKTFTTNKNPIFSFFIKLLFNIKLYNKYHGFIVFEKLNNIRSLCNEIKFIFKCNK